MKIYQIFSIFFVLASFCTKAQNVIATTGGQGQVGNMNVNYTIGEVFVTTYLNNNMMLTQGFHQPYYAITAVEENFTLNPIKVYPNPTASVLNIQFEQPNIDEYSIAITDVSGKLIKNGELTSQVIEVDVAEFDSGYYILTVTNEKSKQSNSYKILKTN